MPGRFYYHNYHSGGGAESWAAVVIVLWKYTCAAKISSDSHTLHVERKGAGCVVPPVE